MVCIAELLQHCYTVNTSNFSYLYEPCPSPVHAETYTSILLSEASRTLLMVSSWEANKRKRRFPIAAGFVKVLFCNVLFSSTLNQIYTIHNTKWKSNIKMCFRFSISWTRLDEEHKQNIFKLFLVGSF